MNRVLAVRGQVLPVSPTPLTLHARLRDGSVVDGQSRIARTRGIDRVWLAPADVAGLDGRGRRRSPRPTRSSSGPGASSRASCPALLVPGIGDAVAAVAGAARLRLQRRDPGRRDERLRPGRPPRGARAPHAARASSTSCSRTTTSRPGRRPTGDAEAVRLRWPPATEQQPRLVLDDVVDPGNAHHHDPAPPGDRAHPARRARDRLATPAARRDRGAHDRAARRPSVRASRAAATAPARSATSSPPCAPSWPPSIPREPCDRRRGGRRARTAIRAAATRRVARLRHRLGATPPLAAPFDWDAAPDHCRTAWLRGRFLARGSLSLAGGRTHLEFVVDPDDAPRARPAPRGRSTCRRPGACGGVAAS